MAAVARGSARVISADVRHSVSQRRRHHLRDDLGLSADRTGLPDAQAAGQGSILRRHGPSRLTFPFGLLSAVCVLGKLAAVPDGHSDVFVAAQGLLAWIVGEGDVRSAQAVDQARGPRGGRAPTTAWASRGPHPPESRVGSGRVGFGGPGRSGVSAGLRAVNNAAEGTALAEFACC
jgi:hypothetical protein